MRILAAGDIHGDQSLSKKLAQRAEQENVDLVILCGDLTQFNQMSHNIIKPFVEKNKKVLLIPGNHDSFATADFLAEIYGVKNIHGYSVRYDQVGIFGCGGANVGIERLEEKEIYDTLKKGFGSIEYLKKRIMVTHVHPTGTTIEKFTRFLPGSSGVRKAVETLQPDLLLCSHVHEAEGIEEMIGTTKVINVGKGGKIIDI